MKTLIITIALLLTGCTVKQPMPIQTPSVQRSCTEEANNQEPYYPARAFALHIEGDVTATYTADENGRIKTVMILKAEPENVFEREVKTAVMKWCVERNSTITQTFKFRLTGVKSD